jgi:hypothetical protein
MFPTLEFFIKRKIHIQGLATDALLIETCEHRTGQVRKRKGRKKE